MDKLEKLNDRISMLSRLDTAQRLGRLEGEVHGMEIMLWLRGDGPEPQKLERTEHKHLQKWLERLYKKLAGGQRE